MNADERSSSYERPATWGVAADYSGQDLDIWGDGRPTNSTPIPEEFGHRDTEDTETTIRQRGQ